MFVVVRTGSNRGSTRLHTHMDVAFRAMVRELDPERVATGSKDAYPADHGMGVSEAHPEAINHRADAYIFDYGTGTGHLIDFTFTNAAKSTGLNGAAPGSHADAEGRAGSTPSTTASSLVLALTARRRSLSLPFSATGAGARARATTGPLACTPHTSARRPASSPSPYQY